MRAKKRSKLTTPDLVLLSLLAERPMHGYQANRELERREIRDWAAISRPQVYYSLEKLTAAGMVRVVRGGEAAQGPERRVFETTAKGKQALADSLEHTNWSTGRDRPVLASAPGHFRNPNDTPARVLAIGAATRRSYAKIDLRRNRARAPRSSLDGEVDDRAVQDGAQVARHARERAQEARTGKTSRVRRSIETFCKLRIAPRRSLSQIEIA
jgi:DNA-binding PadR family transcriptional regulator